MGRLANLSDHGYTPGSGCETLHDESPAQSAPPWPSVDQWNRGLRLEGLGNLAHELRSPLQALLGYLDILRDEIGENLLSRHLHILERMNVNAHDLAQTVENVMAFTVAGAKAESVTDEEIHLHELIAELAPVLEAANDSKHLELKFDLEAAPAVFRSRRRPIKSILLNLVINAIKFTEEGSVTIAIRRVNSSAAGPAIELEVRDTGPGIDTALVAQAFKPGAQLSDSSARHHRGMGLGLAVVQRHVAALGATIKVYSVLRQGSVFIVTIPLADHSGAQPHPLHTI